MDTTLQERISVDADVCNGRARIHGTRIEIAMLLDGLAEGLTPEQLIDHYPQLSQDDIRATLAYAAELSRETVYRVTLA